MKSTLHKKSHKKLVAIIASAVIVLGASAATYALLGKKDDTVEKYGSNTVNPTEDTPKSDTQQGTSPSSSPSISSPKPDPQNPVKEPVYPDSNGGDIKPIAPIGTFVSNHNLTGSHRADTMNSTCTTSPNVLCYISFTKGGEVHTLAAQKADSSGNTSWSWKASDIGLTQGQWTIMAIAKSDSQQTTSSDPTPLTVGQ